MKDKQPEPQIHSSHQHVCPWWFCFSFDNPLRKLFQNPEHILKPYIKPGMAVLDVGPGMGYFTVPLAKLTGENGRVIAVDLQQKMLAGIYRRAVKAKVEKRISLYKCTPDSIGVHEPIDFSLVFWMLHEVPDKARFLAEITAVLKRDGVLLFVEPKIHVSRKNFDKTVMIAEKTGLKPINRPRICMSNAILLKKSG
jgi:ubiquinone/menaquinone biosynthesis C-methylase UbiE